MRKRLPAAIFLILLICQGVLAASSPAIIPMDSSLYRDMDILYTFSGLGSPSTSRPWTKAEATVIFARLDKVPLEGSMLQLYEQVAAELAEPLRFSFADGFQFGVGLEIAGEGYGHTHPLQTRSRNIPPWMRSVTERKPAARLTMDFQVSDLFYTYTDFQYGRNRFIADKDPLKLKELTYIPQTPYNGFFALVPQFQFTPTRPPGPADIYYAFPDSVYQPLFSHNILLPSHIHEIDLQWPRRAAASFGDKGWNILFSRDKLKWGNGKSGNLVIGDHVDYHDYARAIFFTDTFKYDWLTVFLESNPYADSAGIRDDLISLFIAHRLEFRPFPWWTLAMSENLVYKNDILDLRYLMPAFFHHNRNNARMFNAIAHIESTISIAPGWSFYGQFVLDQMRAPTESNSEAAAYGFLVGLEHVRPLEKGILSLSAEFVMTSSALYIRDWVDFRIYHKYFTQNASKTFFYHVLQFDYLGYQYGGDAQVLQLDGEWRIPGTGRLYTRIFALRHGEVDILFGYSKNRNHEPDHNANREGFLSGNVLETALSFTVGGEYQIPDAVSWVRDASLWAQIDVMTAALYDKASRSYFQQHTDLQVTFGIKFGL